jgi:hypothetical protein
VAVSEIHPPLAESQRELEEMLLEGSPFPRVERAIEGAPFDADDKAALWLYAWSLDERLKRKPTVTTTRSLTPVG